MPKRARSTRMRRRAHVRACGEAGLMGSRPLQSGRPGAAAAREPAIARAVAHAARAAALAARAEAPGRGPDATQELGTRRLAIAAVGRVGTARTAAT